MIDNQAFRYGSAAFAEERDLAASGMFTQQPNSLFIGFHGTRPLWYGGMGGVLLTAGARGGKLRDLLAYNICCGICTTSMLILDVKGELAAISQDQTPDHKFCIYWNPRALHGLLQHRINPVDYIRHDNPTLVSDVKLFCENMIPLSGSANAAYFERRAREFLEAVILTLVRLKGALNLPDLYHAINLIPGGGEAWLDFAFEMSESGFPLSVRIEEEIANSREQPTNGFQGILGEIFKAFACLSDPVLLDSVSPPFDFSLAQLCESDQTYNLYVMPPAEFIGPWAPVIKAIFVAGMIYKSRAPQAPQQTWILDECAQLGAFPLVPKLFTYGAGTGIRPVAVLQSSFQAKAIAPDAENIITSSAAVRIYFAVRDIETASQVSRMLGAETLTYDDPLLQSRARHAKQQAMQAFLTGADPLAAGLQFAHSRREAELQTKQQRLLRTPDEVLNTGDAKMYVFTDQLPKPVFADRRPYYDQRFMAGRYHPNPYHPPVDSVSIKSVLGRATRKVVKERVPQRFAHFPQYRDGTWSVIKK